jgi:hypothetical protein
MKAAMLGGRRPNPFRVESSKIQMRFPPGFQSKPWAEISERFQRWGSMLGPLVPLGS